MTTYIDIRSYMLGFRMQEDFPYFMTMPPLYAARAGLCVVILHTARTLKPHEHSMPPSYNVNALCKHNGNVLKVAPSTASIIGYLTSLAYPFIPLGCCSLTQTSE